MVVSLALQGVLPVLTVLLTRHLVDSLVAVAQSKGDPTLLQPAIMYGLLMGLLLLVNEGLSSGSSYLRTALTEQVQDWLNDLVHQQAITLDLQFYESPGY